MQFDKFDKFSTTRRVKKNATAIVYRLKFFDFASWKKLKFIILREL